MSDSGQKEELSFLGNILKKIKFKIRAVFPETSHATGSKLVEAFDGLRQKAGIVGPVLLIQLEGQERDMRRDTWHSTWYMESPQQNSVGR